MSTASVVAVLFVLLAAAAPLALADEGDKVTPVVPLKASPFRVSDVRLLPGPFQHARELDRQYLLSLDPDRLLHCFRVNAGLPSSAKPYGGWESPDSEVRGHFVGHYLSACARMYACTGDEKLKANAQYMVAEMAKCQAKIGSGYLSAFPESFIDRVEAQKPVWAPWYTLHKILAGLLDVHALCGDKTALDVARRFADWEKRRAAKLTDEQFQGMLGNEHGGMNEALANLYAATGDRSYLALAQRFNHHAVLDPLSRHEDRLTGLHANTQIPKFIGAVRQYQLDGDKALYEAGAFAWDVITKERSYVIGGHSDGEAFSDKAHLSQAFGPSTTETCNTYNMLKLTRLLFEIEPRAEYADYYERALYNHILASQNPETGMMCYYVPLRPGSHKEFNTPEDSFWCCTGTGVENHARYGDAIYFREGSKGLFVNLFIASELTWKEKGLTLRQETPFPLAGASSLRFTCARPVRLALHIRYPFWTAGKLGLRLNGAAQTVAGQPGSFVTIERTWRTGDRVDIQMPMSLRTEGFRDNPNRLAFLYGPIVLSAPVDPKQGIPVIVAPREQLPSLFVPAAAPLTFSSDGKAFRRPGVEEGSPVTLSPFYAMYRTPYTVYWDVLTQEQWEAKQEAYRVAEERRREMAARLVDAVHPGFDQSERDHKLAGENTAAGDFGDRKWRHAPEGWFSYELKVEPGVAQDLVVTYWGSDAGNRTFDVLADGVKLATETLANNRPGEFFDRTYPLPSDLVRDKQKVTVRFQAARGNIAGGVFDVSILRRR